MKKAIVLLSGGLDSTIVSYWAVAEAWDLLCLSLDYPGRPKQEKRAAKEIVQRLDLELIESQLPFLSAIKDIPKEASVAQEALAAPAVGYIPMRNLIFFGVAGYYAELYNISYIMAGHNQEDAETYSDATHTFLRLVENVFAETLKQSYITTARDLKIILPLAHLGDSESFRLGQRLGVPFELTWSCWHDGPIPCLQCFACLQRHAYLTSGAMSRS